jgi:hypothetical protein
MKTELQDLIEVITKDIEKSLNEIREIAKNANQIEYGAIDEDYPILTSENLYVFDNNI